MQIRQSAMMTATDDSNNKREDGDPNTDRLDLCSGRIILSRRARSKIEGDSQGLLGRNVAIHPTFDNVLTLEIVASNFLRK